ncbi:hypothetical protein C9994_17050, partial [Marivirga lumbricoides]
MPFSHFSFYGFCLFYAIQSYFLVRYFLKLAYYTHGSEVHLNPSPVSVIICAHNELHNLKSNLEGILKQDYPDFEVIIMDDRSQDGSYEWLKKVQETYQHLQINRIEKTPDNFNSKKYALSEGIKAARHEIILLTDADCRVNSKNWIAKMAHSYKD